MFKRMGARRPSTVAFTLAFELRGKRHCYHVVFSKQAGSLPFARGVARTRDSMKLRLFTAIFILAVPGFPLPGQAAGSTVAPAAPQTAQAPAASPAQPDAAAQAQAQTPPPPPTGANVAPDYAIGPSDSLEINVWKEPTLSGPQPVRPDGMISMSLIGDLQAAGLTPMQLSTAIAGRLKQYINSPLVTVTVLAVNSKKVFLLGEVLKPGELPLSPGMTPLQAIASSGGLTAYANSRHIYILRTVAGKAQKIAFDYKKAIKDGNLQGVTLVAGDTIVVP